MNITRNQQHTTTPNRYYNKQRTKQDTSNQSTSLSRQLTRTGQVPKD